MKKASFLLTMIVLLIAVSSQLIALDVTPREVIIKTHEPLSLRGNRTGITELDGYLQSKSVRSINRVSIPGMNYYVAHLGVEITREDLSDLEFDGVEYIQTNNLNQLYKIPNDTYYYSQELSTIALPEAWDFETGNENITVAVVDSGLLRAHPDLQGRCRLNFGEDADGDGYVMDPVTGVYDPDDLNGIDDDGNGFIDDICGWDFSDAPELEEIALGDYFDQDNDTNDENFHGTHVSGIICANSNNGIGVTGINWESKILPVRAGFRTLEGTGYLQDDDAAAAIIYAVNAGANVINLSWGDDEYSPIIADACEFAYERGAIVVASAGNTPGPLLSYPARLANVISVGSVGRDNDLSSFSSYGPDLDLVAPGEIIKSTYSDGVNYTYGDQSGTSMAAPHVAGCISLLLSRYPNMSFEDVRSKLLASCDDLGSAGRDDYYGSGKLNAFNLIYDESVPDVKLVSPVDNAGYSQGFPIIGTVSSDDFLYYTLMYSFEPVPNQLDWKDIVTHNNRPTEFTTQVYNDVINDFPFLAELPDGNYRLRLEIFDTNYRSYRVIRSFRLDRTAPILNADTVFLYPRYDAENMNYFLQALYNEKVVLNVECENPQGTVYSSTSAYPNELQTVKLPENLPEDLYNFTITATNICGQSSVAHYFEAIVYQSASINGWDRRDVGDGIVAIPKAYDFNGNGKPEVVGMHLIANSYDDVFIYEIGDSLEVTHSFDSAFWPYDIGNTDEDGLDFIGLNLDTIYQYESHGDNDYPITSPSYTESGTAGAYYRDIDLDGVDELMVLRNAATERIWDVKKKNAEGTGYDTYTELRNTSPTNQRNSFVPSIEVGRLDYDNRVDILTADTEGDIMIYETSASEEVTYPVWSFKFAVQNTYYLKTGDFTGDGITDFIVVGYNDDPYNSNNNFWYVELFSTIGDNQYEPIAHLMFDRKQSKNSINAMDTDGDGDLELILGFSPDLYIVDVIDEKLTPVWRGDCSWAYRIVPIQADNARYLLVNDENAEGDVVSVLYSQDSNYLEVVAVPQNFRISLIDGETAKLTWKNNTNAEFFNVHRRGSDGEWTIPVVENSYIDPDLVHGEVYEYAVSAVDNSQSPAESYLTSWKEVTPDAEPALISIEMTGLNELSLVFDSKLSSDAFNIGFYDVDNSIGRPHSVNILNDRRMLLLRFSSLFTEEIFNYNLTITNLKSAMGVPVNITIPFTYKHDSSMPYVTEAKIIGDTKVDIYFSEDMVELDVELLSNYTLTPPTMDQDNQIISVEYVEKDQEKVAEITLSKKIAFSMDPYFVKMTNMHDLAGNRILSTRNLASFIKETNDLKVYPNPVYLEKSINDPILNFVALPEDKKGHLYIYDLSGDIVFKTKLENQSRYTWDLNNNKGLKVSSGMYFYVVSMGDYLKKGKFGIIN